MLFALEPKHRHLAFDYSWVRTESAFGDRLHRAGAPTLDLASVVGRGSKLDGFAYMAKRDAGKSERRV